jgi:hypothetical protein
MESGRAKSSSVLPVELRRRVLIDVAAYQQDKKLSQTVSNIFSIPTF